MKKVLFALIHFLSMDIWAQPVVPGCVVVPARVPQSMIPVSRVDCSDSIAYYQQLAREHREACEKRESVFFVLRVAFGSYYVWNVCYGYYF